VSWTNEYIRLEVIQVIEQAERTPKQRTSTFLLAFVTQVIEQAQHTPKQRTSTFLLAFADKNVEVRCFGVRSALFRESLLGWEMTSIFQEKIKVLSPDQIALDLIFTIPSD